MKAEGNKNIPSLVFKKGVPTGKPPPPGHEEKEGVEGSNY